MTTMAVQRQQFWGEIITRLAQEYHQLPVAERAWIGDRLQRIGQLQQELDALFRRADGRTACAACGGACCARGHHHAGLPTVLTYLQQGLTLPAADFRLTCPWLGHSGCVLAVEGRPYNCITFLCDTLEKRLSAAGVATFYCLDQRLRRLYQEFAARYPGGGTSGLLLQAERLCDRPFLTPRAPAPESDDRCPDE